MFTTSRVILFRILHELQWTSKRHYGKT
uniref:Uncharacterized protein n=1 Tax=Anguilla anguilla TaxID=7936 RepID=A0A0E9QT98_ANGAN